MQVAFVLVLFLFGALLQGAPALGAQGHERRLQPLQAQPTDTDASEDVVASERMGGSAGNERATDVLVLAGSALSMRASFLSANENGCWPRLYLKRHGARRRCQCQLVTAGGGQPAQHKHKPGGVAKSALHAVQAVADAVVGDLAADRFARAQRNLDALAHNSERVALPRVGAHREACCKGSLRQPYWGRAW